MFQKTCSRISFVMLLLYFADIILLGTGQLLRVGGISIRILWFALAGIFSLPLLFRNRKALCKNKYVIAVIAFLLWIAVSGIRGLILQNPRDHLMGDLMGFMNYLLLPTMLCILASESRKQTLCRGIIWSCLLGSVGIFILGFFPLMSNQSEIYQWVSENGLAGITQLTSAATRVFFHTLSRYLFVAYMLILYQVYKRNSWKESLSRILAMGFLVYGIFLSYTRAIYAGCFLGVLVCILLLILKKDPHWKRMLQSVICSGLIALVLITGTGMILHGNLVSAAVNRVLLSMQMPDGSGLNATDGIGHHGNLDSDMGETDFSDGDAQTDISESEMENLDERKMKLDQLNELIRVNPIFGNGLGKSIAFGNGRVEYTYHDILNKMGVVGLILFLTPFLLEVHDASVTPFEINRKKNSLLFKRVTSVSIMVYFLMIAYFNPCMNTSLGISAYLLTFILCQDQAIDFQAE